MWGWETGSSGGTGSGSRVSWGTVLASLGAAGSSGAVWGWASGCWPFRSLFSKSFMVVSSFPVGQSLRNTPFASILMRPSKSLMPSRMPQMDMMIQPTPQVSREMSSCINPREVLPR